MSSFGQRDWGNVNPSEISHLLGELTLVIPTRNRREDVEALLFYWRHWPVHILILDGSDEPLSFSSSYSNFQSFETYHSIDLGDRFHFASEHLTSQFACIQPDDDFYLPRAAARALDNFRIDSSIDTVVANGFFFDSALRFFPSSQARSIDATRPLVSMHKHLMNYSWTYVYALHRSETLAQLLRIVGSSISGSVYRSNPHSVAAEWAFEIAGSMSAQTFVHFEPFFLKAVGNQSEYLLSESNTWKDWLTAEIYSQAINDWLQNLSSGIGELVNIDSKVIESSIRTALEDHDREDSKRHDSTKRAVAGRRSFPVRVDKVGRWSDVVRPKHHPLEDSFVNLWVASLRKLHRVLFYLLRAAFRLFIKREFETYVEYQTQENWGDRGDILDFVRFRRRPSQPQHPHRTSTTMRRSDK